MQVWDIEKGTHVDFLRTVAAAKEKDRIIYHRGASCQVAPLRLWALGASDAGLVLLVKIRVKPNEPTFEHVAIRGKKKFRPFKKAVEIKF